MQRFTDLEVWKRGHELTLAVYDLTRKFPREEMYGLTSQVRRASSSIPINIAEGSKMASNKRYAWHLNTSEGSLAETEYELMLARDLKYVDPSVVNPLFGDIAALARMLHNLRTKVERGAK